MSTSNQHQQQQEEEDDLAPNAGMMLVALTRASLKHLSSRDGFNLCSEDLTIRQNQQQQQASSSPEDETSRMLLIALDEIATAADQPLETRLYAALTVLARALDEWSFVSLLDPQVLLCHKLASRALGLCDLLRMTNRDTSLDAFSSSIDQEYINNKTKREKMREEMQEELSIQQQNDEHELLEAKKKHQASTFSEQEVLVIEATLRCYMTICLCALGAWDHARHLADEIYALPSLKSISSYDEDENNNNSSSSEDPLHPLEGASPFRDVRSAKMFRVMVAGLSQLQSLTVDALATRKEIYAANNDAYPHLSSLAKHHHNSKSTNTPRGHNNNNPSSRVSNVLHELETISNHGKKLLLVNSSSTSASSTGRKSSQQSSSHNTTNASSSSSPTAIFESQMLHIAKMSTSTAVLCEAVEICVRRLREKEFAAEKDQRKLFRKLKLCKDPNEARNIQSTAQGLGTARESEQQKQVAVLNRFAGQLWSVICECVFVCVQNLNEEVIKNNDKNTNTNNKDNNSTSSSSYVNAGCAITVTECLRCLALIRSIPSVDKSLIFGDPSSQQASSSSSSSSFGDLFLAVSKSTITALGDASPWSLHIKITTALALMRYPDLPPPSPITAWSISPDVLSCHWSPPQVLLTKCDEMIELIGKRKDFSSSSSRDTSKKNNKKSNDDGNDSSATKIDENWFNDVLEATMLLDQVTTQRDQFFASHQQNQNESSSSSSKKRRRNRKNHQNSSASSNSIFALTMNLQQFDPCEYLGGSAKVAALIDALEIISLNNNSNTNNSMNTNSTATGTNNSITATMLTSRGGGDNNNNNVAASYASTAYAILTTSLPMLSDSVIRDTKRLRMLISKRVPEANAVTAEHHRRNSPPGSSRRAKSPTSASKYTNNNKPGASSPLVNPNSNINNPNRRTKIKVTPCGGVLKNGSQISFKVLNAFSSISHTPELLACISTAQDNHQQNARIFKPVDGDITNPKFTVEMGRHAPGWAEVNVILRVAAADEERENETLNQTSVHRDEKKQKKKNKSKKARKDGSSDDSDESNSSSSSSDDDESEKEEEEQQETSMSSNKKNSSSSSSMGKILAVATARYYVVTHASSTK